VSAMAISGWRAGERRTRREGKSSESSENYRWNRFHSSYRPSRRDLQGTIEEVLVTTRCVVVSIMASSGSSRTTGRRCELHAGKGKTGATTQSYIGERRGWRAVVFVAEAEGTGKKCGIGSGGSTGRGSRPGPPQLWWTQAKIGRRVGLWQMECQHGHQHHVLSEASRWPVVFGGHCGIPDAAMADAPFIMICEAY